MATLVNFALVKAKLNCPQGGRDLETHAYDQQLICYHLLSDYSTLR